MKAKIVHYADGSRAACRFWGTERWSKTKEKEKVTCKTCIASIAAEESFQRAMEYFNAHKEELAGMGLTLTKVRAAMRDHRPSVTVIYRDGLIVVRHKVTPRHCRMHAESLAFRVANALKLPYVSVKANVYGGRVGLYHQDWAEAIIHDGEVE